MPPLTDAEYKAQVLADLYDPEGVLAPLIDRLWAMYADVSTAPAQGAVTIARYRLRYFAVEQAALRVLLGRASVETDVSQAGAMEIRGSQKFKQLTQLYTFCETEMARIRKSLRLPLVAPLLATAILEAEPPGVIDPNRMAYRGDARQPSYWGTYWGTYGGLP